MSPQLVDFDADGIQDMVMGTFEGVAFLVRGTDKGYKQHEYIRDEDGNSIMLSQFWCRENNKWDEADFSGDENHQADHMISAVAVDWDGDGDYDLLLGSKEGRMYLRRNEGSFDEPAFATTNELLPIEAVPGGLTAPRLVDWNEDGQFDLLCPSFDGGVYLYLADEPSSEPQFSSRMTLVTKGKGHSIRGESGPVPTSPVRPDRGSYADLADYDGDGDLDLLVGGYATYKPAKPELTSEQEAELAELLEQETALKDVMREALQKLRDEEEGARERYSELRGEMEALTDKIQVLDPREVVQGCVWLYRRN